MTPRKPKIVDGRRALLEWARDQIQAAVKDAQTPDASGKTQPAAVAALSRELRAVLAELEQATPAEVSAADAIAADLARQDELARKRSARSPDAPDRSSATRRSQPRRSNGSHRAG